MFSDRSAMTLIRHYYKLQSRGTENKAISTQFTLWKFRRKKGGAGITESTKFWRYDRSNDNSLQMEESVSDTD